MTKEEFREYVDSYGKKPGEYTDDEMYEICMKGKEFLSPEDKIGLWGELAVRFGVNPGHGAKKGEALRCKVKKWQKEKGTLPKSVRMMNGHVLADMTEDTFERYVEKGKRELYMAQVLARDAMNEYRDDLRKDARSKYLVDCLERCAGKCPPLPVVGETVGKDGKAFREAIIAISDWHIGMQIDNPCNTYNADIAAKRMAKMADDVVNMCLLYKVKRLHVLDLGDEIHGLIHNGSRLSQEYDVAEQVMIASELLAQVIARLRIGASEVVYHSCLDNHSRMMANYKDSKDTENFGRIIAFYLRSRFAGDRKVSFAEDHIDPTLGMFDLENGETVMYAHGHLDNPTQAVQEISGIVNSMRDGRMRRVSYFIVGHYHSEKMKAYQGVRVIVNGSGCGTDEYAFSKRLVSKPSQTMLVFDGDNLVENRIGLDIRE